MATTYTSDDFVQFVAPDVPDAPIQMVKRQIMITANDFLIQTGAWDEIQDPVSVIDNVHTYEIDTPTGAQVSTIKNIWMSNRELIPVSIEQLVDLLPNWQTAAGSEPAYYNAAADWETYRIYPIPVDANKAKMTLRVAYTVNQFGTLIPSLLINYWLEEIAAGAKARLMMMAAKPWTNPAAAAVNMAVYNNGIVKAKVFMAHGKVVGNLRVRPVRFG